MTLTPSHQTPTGGYDIGRDVIKPALNRKKFPKEIGPRYVAIVMPWVESYWSKFKRYPSPSEFLQAFGLDSTEVLRLNSNKFYLQSLDRRGIARPEQTDASGRPVGLTDRQVAAIAILTNYHDLRDPISRLSMIGVTTEELQGWRNNETFNVELSRRADEAFDFVAPDAAVALASQVKKGNLNAIKFYYEITGKVQTPEVVNLKQLIQVLIEAVQKHVKDQETLDAIGREVDSIRKLTQ